MIFDVRDCQEEDVRMLMNRITVLKFFVVG